MLNEKLIKDYCLSIEQIHDDYRVVDVSVAGEWVMFTEKSPCAMYRSQRQIPLLDIVAWVYSKITLAV